MKYSLVAILAVGTTAPPAGDHTARIRKIVQNVPRKGEKAVLVIGAHEFGQDPNDPTFRLVAGYPWAAVYAVEPNPPIYEKLAKALIEGLPHVAPERVVADRAAVLADAKTVETTLSFYCFRPTEADVKAKRFPFWIDQTSSLDRAHVVKHYDYGPIVHKVISRDEYEKRIERINVIARSLTDEYVVLERIRASRNGTFVPAEPAVIQIDAEGFDCRIVAANAPWLARARPALLVFEHKHCIQGEVSKVLSALRAAAAAPAFLVLKDSENVYVHFPDTGTATPSHRN